MPGRIPNIWSNSENTPQRTFRKRPGEVEGHRPQRHRNHRTKGERQHRSTIFAIKLGADVSWVQNKRESLACQSGHKTGGVKQTVEARFGKTE